MTHPSAHRTNRLLTPALIGALAALVLLAVVTLVVVLNKDDGGTSSGGTTTSAGPPSTTEPVPDPGPTTTITSDHGVQYSYPTDGYPDQNRWIPQQQADTGLVLIDDLTGYVSCVPDAGQDVIYGFVPLDVADLEAAATKAAQDLADSVWVSDGGTDTTPPTTPAEKTLPSGITGQGVEIQAERADPDECGSTRVHIITFAFKVGSETIVFVSSFRTDGDAVKNEKDLGEDVLDTIRSIELT